MTQTLIAGLANAGVGTGATNYASIGTGRLTTSSAVANYKTTWRTAGTFSNLYCRITANAASTSNSNINYFVGAGVGNQSVVITKSVTGEFTDTTDNDVAAAGNVIAYQIVNGGGGTLSVQTITELFSPTTAGNSVNLVMR